MAVIGGFRSDLSIVRKTDGNFGNVSASVLFSKVAYQRKRCGKAVAKTDNTSAIADDVDDMKRDHFDNLAKGKTDYRCKIRETLFTQELKPAFNVNVGSEKLMLY